MFSPWEERYSVLEYVSLSSVDGSCAVTGVVLCWLEEHDQDHRVEWGEWEEKINEPGSTHHYQNIKESLHEQMVEADYLEDDIDEILAKARDGKWQFLNDHLGLQRASGLPSDLGPAWVSEEACFAIYSTVPRFATVMHACIDGAPEAADSSPMDAAAATAASVPLTGANLAFEAAAGNVTGAAAEGAPVTTWFTPKPTFNAAAGAAISNGQQKFTTLYRRSTPKPQYGWHDADGWGQDWDILRAGLPSPVIRCLAARAGIWVVNSLIYEETRGILMVKVQGIVRNALKAMQFRNANVIERSDVEVALQTCNPKLAPHRNAFASFISDDVSGQETSGDAPTSVRQNDFVSFSFVSFFSWKVQSLRLS